MKYLTLLFLIGFSNIALSDVETRKNLEMPDNKESPSKSQTEAKAIKACDALFNDIHAMNKKLSAHSQNAMIAEELNKRVAYIKDLIDSLPEENKIETCMNMQIQYDSLLPGILELEKTALAD